MPGGLFLSPCSHQSCNSAFGFSLRRCKQRSLRQDDKTCVRFEKIWTNFERNGNQYASLKNWSAEQKPGKALPLPNMYNATGMLGPR